MKPFRILLAVVLALGSGSRLAAVEPWADAKLRRLPRLLRPERPRGPRLRNRPDHRHGAGWHAAVHATERRGPRLRRLGEPAEDRHALRAAFPTRSAG